MIQPWHIFVALLLITWICIAVTIFFNKYLHYLQQFGLFVVLVGGLVTIVVVAAMPKQHASNSFVWTDWNNQSGWGGGVAFLAGVLNGAFTIGTPDAVTHMAEEVPHPRKDLPKAIAAQIILGSISKLHVSSPVPSRILINFSSRLRLRHNPLLRHHRPRSRPKQ